MNQSEYFTPEQLEKFKTQSERIGQDTIKNVENEWPKFIASIRGELEKGTPRSTRKSNS